MSTERKSITAIFPIPVWLEILDHFISPDELNFVLNLERCPNVGNSRSLRADVLESEIFSLLKQKLSASLSEFISKVYYPAEPVSPYITQSWINYTNTGQYHHAHTHPNSFISGVYYLQADPAIDEINFSKAISSSLEIKSHAYGLFNSRSWSIPVETNQLILFPSTLAHMVKPTVGANTRISLSFNSFLRGNLGSYDNLDHLHLE